MMKTRILLICSQHLLGEGLGSLLKEVGGFELFGPMDPTEDIFGCLDEVKPDVIVMADEDSNSEGVVELTNKIMRGYPELPIIRTGLTRNLIYIVETHALPARGTDLIETIRGLPVAQIPQKSASKDQKNKGVTKE